VAKQFKRANRALKTLQTYLGRVVRDIGRKIRGEAELESVFAHPLMLARRVREQRQHQRGRKIYSLHGPRSNASARARRIAPTSSVSRSRSPRPCIVRRADSSSPKSLPGNPYDGHTLATVIPEMEAQLDANLTRIVADRGYRGHNAPLDHRFRVYISGRRRRVTEPIKRELRPRSAVEPVIEHAKAEHRMGRNHLARTEGDAANAVLAAAGYNFRRLLQWLRLLLCLILAALTAASHDQIPAPAQP
jgi:transposase, IS5 family